MDGVAEIRADPHSGPVARAAPSSRDGGGCDASWAVVSSRTDGACDGGGRRAVERAAAFVRPHRRQIAAVLGLALVLAICNAAEPLVMRRLFDTLAIGRGLTALGWTTVGLVGLEAIRATVGRRVNVGTWTVRLALDFAVRETLVTKLGALPLAYHQRERVGGTITKLNRCITEFVAGVCEVAFKLLPTAVYLGLAVVAMARMEWRLSLLVLLFAPIPALIAARASRVQTRRERMLATLWTRLYARFAEVLTGIVTVKGFAMEGAERARFLRATTRGNGIVRRGVTTDSWIETWQGLATTLARISALAWGGVLVYRGEITLGTLIAFLGYIAGLFGPVQGLTTMYQTSRRALVALEQIFDILDQPGDAADAVDARRLGPIRGDVTFRNVSFAYPTGDLVLEDVTLHIGAGESIALVGPSGSGKTTLLMLLQRFYLPTAGHVSIDGVDIAGVAQESLRGQLGVGFQDVHLFHDTVCANIMYGSPQATRAEVEAAARAANAHDFIVQLPDGYDTVLGERGAGLSGGQRQRVAIARAVLRQPPILLLDEATSALDGPTETAVRDAVTRLSRGRTTIVVAHRLSTIMNADRIVVMEAGRIVAIGTHADLVRDCDLYRHLFATALAEAEDEAAVSTVESLQSAA